MASIHNPVLSGGQASDTSWVRQEKGPSLIEQIDRQSDKDHHQQQTMEDGENAAKSKKGIEDLISAIRSRDFLEVQSLLKGSSFNINSLDDEGRTPLLWAVGDGFSDRQSSRHERTKSWGFGHSARKILNIVESLLEMTSIDVNIADKNGRTPLSWAVQKADFEILRLFFKRSDIDITSKDNKGWTPLFWAITNCRWAVDSLLKMGKTREDFDVNLADNTGRTLLSWAAERADARTMELLVIAGANVNSRASCGRTPLSFAAGHSNTDAVSFLVKQPDIAINCADKEGRTPLSWAVEKGCCGVVELLIWKAGVNFRQRDIDMNAKDEQGRTPLLWVKNINIHPPFPPFGRPKSPAFGQKEKSARVQVLESLLTREDVQVNSVDNEGKTLLSWASQNGDLDIVEVLARKSDIDVDLKDNKSRTPLSWAAQQGHTEIVKQLLKKGAEVESTDKDDRTALWYTIEREHWSVMSQLAKRDILIFHKLVQAGNELAVHKLLSMRYDASRVDSHQRTPLHIAALHGKLGITKALVDHYLSINQDDFNLRINQEDLEGMSPIALAIERRHLDVTEFLFQSSAEVKNIKASSWFEVCDKGEGGMVCLVEGRSGRHLHFATGNDMIVELERVLANDLITRRFIFFKNCSPWSEGLIQHSSILTPQRINPEAPDWPDWVNVDPWKIRIEKDVEEEDSPRRITFSLAVRMDAAEYVSVKDEALKNLDWGRSIITWNMKFVRIHDGPEWKSSDHFSTLQDGGFADNGAEFFTQFIRDLEKKWLELCSGVERQLSERRDDQLNRESKSDIIHDLAEDARKRTQLRGFLHSHIETSTDFIEEFCHRYSINGRKEARDAISQLKKNINRCIDKLDQTGRDLLQLEFAWVSVEEARTSTSTSTSMKQLSWITFIFLPPMFASSLFGMNVDLLKHNPDWRWYILFGGSFLIITILGWLVFKRAPDRNFLRDLEQGWTTNR